MKNKMSLAIGALSICGLVLIALFQNCAGQNSGPGDGGAVSAEPGAPGTENSSGVMTSSKVVLSLPFSENANPKSYTDIGPYGFAATCAGGKCPQPAELGKLGHGLSFEKEYLKIPHDELLTPEKFTLDVWVRIPKNSGTAAEPDVIVAKSTDRKLKDGYGLLYTPKTRTITLYINDASSEKSRVESVINSDENVQITGIYSGEKLKLFFNGWQVAEKELSDKIDHSTKDLEIGAVDGLRLFKGIIDEVVLRNGPLSEKEIKAASQANYQSYEVSVADFAGVTGTVEGKPVLNPANGKTACPLGFKSIKVMGTKDKDGDLSFCFRFHTSDEEEILDFGGMYSSAKAGKAIQNPITKGETCPAGFTALKVYGSNGKDDDIFLCHRKHTKGDLGDYLFGGMYGVVDGQKVENPVTSSDSCPAGYTSTQILGEANNDSKLFYCFYVLTKQEKPKPTPTPKPKPSPTPSDVCTQKNPKYYTGPARIALKCDLALCTEKCSIDRPNAGGKDCFEDFAKPPFPRCK